MKQNLQPGGGGGTVCFTSFSLGYLSRARLLADSLRRAHPDWRMVALLVDAMPADPGDAFAPFDAVVAAEALGIADFAGWMFKHDLVEACTAVKAPMLRALLQDGAERVIYLDPDIAVFHPLTGLMARLDDRSILLTPHQCAPSGTAQGVRDNELTTLQYGVYNLGFLAVRNDAAGRDFADWWTAMTHRACYDDVEHGIFTDQKYCDLVPGMFDGVDIARDPGCNVASWNLERRALRFAPDGSLAVSDGMSGAAASLKFYHFSKIGGIGDAMTARYAGDGTEVFEMVKWYKRRLRDFAVPGVGGIAWRYGYFANAVPIPRAARLLWRDRADLRSVFADPFAAHGDSFLAWLRRERPELLAGDVLG